MVFLGKFLAYSPFWETHSDLKKFMFDANLTIYGVEADFFNFCYNLGAFYIIIKIISCLNVV